MAHKLINYLLVLVFLLTASGPDPALALNQAQVPAGTGETPEVQVDESLDLTQLSPFADFILHFNQAMDPSSADRPILTYPYVEGESTWSEGNTTLTFTPSEGYTPGKDYTFYLDPDLLSAAGGSFAETQYWEATIQRGPQVYTVTPSSANLQERNPAITVTFSGPMEAQSVSEALSIQPVVPYTLSWREHTMAINLGEALDPGTRYNLTIAASARDTQGIPMVEDYRWDYYLAAFQAEVVPPSLDYHGVKINFNYAVDSDASGTPFTISPVVEGEWVWNNDRQVEFTPVEALDSARRYTINTTGPLYDLQGDELPALPNEMTFIPPAPIRTVYPIEDIYNSMPLDIYIVFDKPMDHTSTESAFEVSPALGGNFEWQDNRLTFHPTGRIQSYTTYVVTLHTTATDAEGNLILAEPYSWSFDSSYQDQTGAAFSLYGPNAQVVDANGRRAIQFVTHDDTVLNFSLYEMELMDFAQRYANDFGQTGWYDASSIDTTGLEASQTWQVTLTTTGIQEVLLPDDVPPGLYVMNVSTRGVVQDQLFVILTSNTLVVKRAGDELFIWASDINGDNLPALEIRLYSSRGEMIRQGETNEDGIYRTTIPTGYEPMLVAGRDGSDVTVSGLEHEWSSSYSYWWWADAGGSRVKNYTAYTYTDRPIYRPGDTVYFKTILREDDDVVYTTPPQGTPVTVRILDARDNVLQTFELAVNDFGSAEGEFQVAEGAMLGDYAVEVLVQDEAYSQAFKVQDYRKPDFQVAVTTDAEQYVQGEQVTVNIDASYYFGEPLPNASLTIRRYVLGQNYYWWWNEGSSSGEYQWHYVAHTTTGRTDSNGHYSFTFPAEVNDYSYSSDWRSSLERSLWGLEVTADDGSNQLVSNVVVYPVYNAAYSLSMDTGGYLKSPGQSFNAHLELTSLSGEAATDRLVRIIVYKWSGYTNYTENYIALNAYSLTTDAEGIAEQELVFTQPGYYKLLVSSVDDDGNEISYERWIYVFEEGNSWASRANLKLRITAEQESYRPGNMARFIIESSFSGPALLTFERGSVIQYKPIMLTAPMTIVEAEITYYYAPNVYVAVSAWEGQDTTLTARHESWDSSESRPDSWLYHNSTEIQVEVVGKQLNVTITPDQPVYGPREQATFTIQVTDEQGQPVVAEVSLAMVDEAIFALSSDLSAPIFEAFYGRRNWTVDTYDSMAPTRILDFMGGGGGGDGMEGGPRSDFPDTAVWYPTLYTDENGQVSVTVTLPDSLTSWRLTARAVTAGTLVGETVTNIITQKEIVVRPILPAGLTGGDQVELTAFVHNYGETTQDVTVTLTITSLLSTTTPLSQVIRVEPGGITPVEWTVTAAEAGTAQVVIEATAGEGSSDAVLLPLTIRPLAIPDFYTQIGDFSGEFLTTLVLPETALEMSEVEIHLSRSAAGTLLDGLEYLTGYPYGCVEQTMSRALPNAVVGRALYQLGVSNPELEGSLPGLISASVQRLYGFQHSDGGWGWWFDDATQDYQTAWVVFGLATTQEAGYEIDPQVIQNGTGWLLEHLAEMDIRTRAYALYSLAIAGYGDLEQTQAMLPQLYELDTFSQAALALALHELGDDEDARIIVEALSDTAIQRETAAGTLVYWPHGNEDGHYNQKTMSSTIRSTALALDAFARIDPENTLIPGIVTYLMGERRSNGWGSTNETAYTIIALTDHLVSVQSGNEQTAYRIELNGEEVVAGNLGQGQPSTSLTLPASQLNRGANLLRIAQEGETRLYYTITSRMYLPQPEVAAAGTVLIERAYLDPRTNRALSSPQPGQLVRVELTITIHEGGSFIIIEDMLPGGLEALNESLNTSSHMAEMDECYDCTYFYWETYGYNNKEVHPDRVTFFITDFSPGVHRITYLARVTHAGTFVAMPAEVYAMYEASIWGRSASNVLVISK